MSRRTKMIDSPYTACFIPLSEHEYLRKLVEAKALKAEGGIAKRKAITIETKTSETALIKAAKACGFGVVRAGTHYLIYNGKIAFETLQASLAMSPKD
ncbi:hypothetical protein [Sphingobium sp. CFD-2]|uniref:hypothetical protein n=1 Tax=Sphingobium sp. CFD-2 TaxID=2878542 RepID=UPI00214C9055|nr:hypothetical protein [Sphingobium sp. CFD-2]